MPSAKQKLTTIQKVIDSKRADKKIKLDLNKFLPEFR